MSANRAAPHTVYLHRDKDGAVIYAGCTRNLASRTAMHRYRSGHWPQVAAVEVESVQPTFAAGRLRESVLIEELDPKYNVKRPFPPYWYSVRMSEGITPEEEAACADVMAAISPEEVYAFVLYGSRPAAREVVASMGAS